jgi:hypothetical protein
MIKAVPKIQRDPRTVSDNARHYGYVAYQDIRLSREQIVQPDNSPYYHVIPCRELIPFTNIEVGEMDEKKYAAKINPPVTKRPKSALECAREMENAYADWNFTVLRPLTGFTEDDAFRIFQVVQPFAYKLKDAQIYVGAAEERIERDESYTVSYEGETVELHPLTDEEREVAREVQRLVLASINLAFDRATEKTQKTVTSMTRAFAGGEGKVTPDPLDRKLAPDLGIKLPQLIDVQEQEKKTADDDLKREEIELRRKEIELRERELALREAEANRAETKKPTKAAA